MKGFVISWFYPPMNSSEGLVTFKLLKESSYQYDVFTQKTCQNWSYGNTEKKLVSKNINPIYSEKETYEDWIEEGLEFFSQNKDKYDFIMSRATPKESHLLALKIKEKFPDVKWIASFGDPLANSPYEKVLENKSPYSLEGRTWGDTSKKYIFSPKRIIKNILWNRQYGESKEIKAVKAQAQYIEDTTIKVADMIILNNRYEKKFMLNKYDSAINSKAIIVNHSYDESFYPKTSKKKNVKRKIVYLGHLDQIRNASIFLEAINNIFQQKPKLLEGFEIEFYGNMCDADKLYIINNELYEIIKVKKAVDYFTSLKIMQESEYLLLLDANLENIIDYNPYFAAKLADYIGAHNKILAITMAKGASAEIVKCIGGIVMPHDSLAVTKELEKILANKINYQENKDNSAKFANNFVAKQFDKEVKKMMEDK